LVHNDLGPRSEEHRRATHWLANGARSFILKKPYKHSISFLSGSEVAAHPRLRARRKRIPDDNSPFAAGGR
jgi:hypothetical protein